MIHFEGSGRALQEQDLATVEAAIGHPLPPPYRAFLLEHNGGRPKPNIVDIEHTCFTGSDIQVFYGIDVDEVDTILWNFEALEGCKENALLPIANDSGACPYFIVFAGEGVGEIWFLHRREDPHRMYLVAPDFNSFLAKIRDFTPEEWAEIDAMIGKNDPGSEPS